MSMTKSQIVEWIQKEFGDVQLATPVKTLMQQVDNAIAYWNTHSAFKTIAMVDYVRGQTYAALPAKFKAVAEVIPNYTTTWILQDQPLWSLLGLTILDNVTEDLIIMGEAFRSYRKYVGTDFRWSFIRSEDPEVGGQLYIINVPNDMTRVCVVGSRRINPKTDSIDSEHIYNWVRRYAKSLVKVSEGNALRKGSIIGVQNDGQAVLNEGKEEIEALQNELAVCGRWMAFSRRF